jgi:hypothetical protein
MQSDSETLESLVGAVTAAGVATLGVKGSIAPCVTGFLCENDDKLVDITVR